MKQSLLKIALPQSAAPLFAGDFKEMLAKGGDGSALLPPAFFHYGDDGRPLPTTEPEIRFVGGKGWVGILSMRENSELFERAVGIAARVASKHFNRPLPITIENPTFGLESSPVPQTYYLRDMAVKMGKRARERPVEEVVRERIAARIGARGALYGIDVPTAEQLGIAIHDLKHIGMRLRTATGDTQQFVTLVNAEFSMYAKLQGLWQIGYLQSRGHGRIIPKGAWNRGDNA